MKPLAFVTGMAVEAACIERVARAARNGSLPPIHVSGGVPASALAGARRLIANGAGGLVSFGVAGGLDPALSPGDLVCGSFVWQENGPTCYAAPPWPSLPAPPDGSGRRVVYGGVAGVEAPVRSVAGKAALLASSNAAVVDMESHCIAAAAGEAGVPYYVIRAVADPALRHVPDAALAGIAPDGARRPLAVVARLLARPWEIPGIVRLAGDSRVALNSLSCAASFLLGEYGPGK